MAAPNEVAAVRRTSGEGAADVRALVAGPTGILHAAAPGYRIDSFTDTRASVAVWLVALAGGQTLDPVAQWRVRTIDLVWTRGHWLVDGGRGGPGPSPLSPCRKLAAEASTFVEVRHVP